jgi:hypothetical protein
MTKRAFLVGVNAYHPPITSLKGCVNDIHQMRSILQEYYGFKPQDIKLLDWLVEGAQSGDVLVFHYSGHGSHVADENDDEWDCRDEILIPIDHDWNHPLRDDDLKTKFDRVPLGANLTIISDSCHSGTINKDITETEVPRVVLVPPEIQVRVNAKVAKRNAEYKAFVADEYRRLARKLTPDELDARIEDFLAEALDRFKENRFQFVDTRQNNILLAGCQDVQTSADAYIDGDWHGAFTYNLVRAIVQADGTLTHSQLIAEAGKGMVEFQQVPQLECPGPLRELPTLSTLPDQA